MHISKIPLTVSEMFTTFADVARLTIYVRDESGCKKVFQGKEIVKTKNMGKVSQAVAIALANRNPITAAEIQSGCEHFLLKATKSVVYQAPYDGGHCLGGVVWFFGRLATLKDVESVASEFQEGLPKEAIHHQTLFESTTLAWDVEEVTRLINDSEALRAQDGKTLSQQAALHYITTPHALDLSRHQYAYSLVGLNVETCICSSETGENFIACLKSGLSDGYYALSIPCFSHQGKEAGRHALGLYVAGEKAYYFDPNFAIGVFEKSEIGAVSERILTYYSGIAFEAGKIQPFSLKRWFKNYLLGASNSPYQGKIGEEFTLYKVGKGPSYNGL